MKVKVCDAICGAGKTVSCINMMNEREDVNFIFITPYLDEVDRIKEKCASRHFVSPEKTYESGFSKLSDIHSLMEEDACIASTHALFSSYTDETRKLIRDHHYVLVLDEVVNIFQPAEISPGDMKILYRSGAVEERNDEVHWKDEDYNEGFYEEIMYRSKSKNLIRFGDDFYFWSIPVDVFNCFDDVYVLTYLFNYQYQKYFFDLRGVDYELIGTKRVGDTYQFCPIAEMDRKIELRDKIHILDVPRLNEIGDKIGSLSVTWYDRCLSHNHRALDAVKNNLYNVFHNLFKSDTNDRMWSTYGKFRNYVKSPGNRTNFLVYNQRASNNHSHKHYLAYLVNVYMQPWARNYLIANGAEDVNQEMWALSTMIQWVFRSAIRRGEEIWLYVPSFRMRYLFTQWMENLALGRDLEPIEVIYPETTKRGQNKKLKPEHLKLPENYKIN